MKKLSIQNLAEVPKHLLDVLIVVIPHAVE